MSSLLHSGLVRRNLRSSEAEVLPAILTVREAAAFLRLYEKSLRKLVFRGEIPAFRITSGPRGRLRFRRSVLESWVRDREAAMRRETEVG